MRRPGVLGAALFAAARCTGVGDPPACVRRREGAGAVPLAGTCLSASGFGDAFPAEPMLRPFVTSCQTAVPHALVLAWRHTKCLGEAERVTLLAGTT
ncbi:hypothetical protein ABZW49_34355 [Nonomuraea wenchangensis]